MKRNEKFFFDDFFKIFFVDFFFAGDLDKFEIHFFALKVLVRRGFQVVETLRGTEVRAQKKKMKLTFFRWQVSSWVKKDSGSSEEKEIKFKLHPEVANDGGGSVGGVAAVTAAHDDDDDDDDDGWL